MKYGLIIVALLGVALAGCNSQPEVLDVKAEAQKANEGKGGRGAMVPTQGIDN